MNEQLNPTIIIEDNHKFSSLSSGKLETKIHEEERKSLQGFCSEGEEEVSHEHEKKYVEEMEEYQGSSPQ